MTPANGGDGAQRSWHDLCPDLLNSIYHNLPAAGRLGFRSVCRNWRRVAVVGRRHAAPLKPAVMSYDDPEIPGEVYKELSRACVKYCWPGSGWWLLAAAAGGIFGLFNPLFRWPTCFVRLPILPHSVSQPPLKAAFSAPPNDPDWAIFLVRGHREFGMFRRGGLRWENYTCGGEGERRVCEGIGYREGSFFCLFDTGDVLIFGVEGRRRLRRTMMVAVAAPPVMLARQDYLRVVAAESDGRFLVMSWGRGGGGIGDSRLRLLGVGRETAEGLKEGRRRWGSDIIVREESEVSVEVNRVAGGFSCRIVAGDVVVVLCVTFVVLTLVFKLFRCE